jgi:hypothetical protein
VYDDRQQCSHDTAQVGITATIGTEGKLYGTYL